MSSVILRGLNNFELARGDVVNDTVELEVPLAHGVDNGRVHSDDLQTAKDVILSQSETFLLVVHLLKLIRVLHSELSHWLQPNVEETQSVVAEGSADTTAAGVAADKNVLDLEVLDSELNDREGVDVGSGDNVGDVAVDKDLTGLQTQDGCLRNT